MKSRSRVVPLAVYLQNDHVGVCAAHVVELVCPLFSTHTHTHLSFSHVVPPMECVSLGRDLNVIVIKMLIKFLKT